MVESLLNLTAKTIIRQIVGNNDIDSVHNMTIRVNFDTEEIVHIDSVHNMTIRVNFDTEEIVLHRFDETWHTDFIPLSDPDAIQKAKNMVDLFIINGGVYDYQDEWKRSKRARR